jgi:hypothetical protein
MSVGFSYLPLILIVLTTNTLLIFRNWKVLLSALAVQYIGIFSLIILDYPAEVGAIKLLVGLMICTVLGITLLSNNEQTEKDEPKYISGYLFRGISGAIFTTIIFVFLEEILSIFPENSSHSIIICSIVLIITSILQMGTSKIPLKIIIGLFTFLSGFDMLYLLFDRSILLDGLMAGINLVLALLGSYFIRNKEEA